MVEIFRSEIEKPKHGFDELYSMFKNVHWKQVERELRDFERSGNSYMYLGYASFMREFDQKRFDERHVITDDMWFLILEHINHFQNLINNTGEEAEVYSFLEFAEQAKTIDSGRFARDVRIKPTGWHNIFVHIRQQDKLKMFLMNYDKAWQLGHKQELQDAFLTEERWGEIRQSVENTQYAYTSLNRALMASYATRVQPQGFPDITVDQRTWNMVKTEVGNILRARTVPNKEILFIQTAVGLRDVKIR